MTKATDLREIGRPVVAAWLEVRNVRTLRAGDAADLMERVGAAIEAELAYSRAPVVAPQEDGSLTPEQFERATLIAESRGIDLETAQELVYLRDRSAASSPVSPVPPEDLPFDDYCAGADCRNCKGINCTCPHHANEPTSAPDFSALAEWLDMLVVALKASQKFDYNEWGQLIMGAESWADRLRPAATPTPVEQEQRPIDMILFCPRCGTQHVDAPESEEVFQNRMQAFGLVAEPQDRFPSRWTNPPHKSHLCHNCYAVWRPADVPTNGVAQIKTRGKEDNTWTNSVAVPATLSVREAAEEIAAIAAEDPTRSRLLSTAFKQRVTDTIVSHLNVNAVSAAGGDEDHLRWLLTRIIHDLPARHDWLDPDLEREARTYMK